MTCTLAESNLVRPVHAFDVSTEETKGVVFERGAFRSVSLASSCCSGVGGGAKPARARPGSRWEDRMTQSMPDQTREILADPAFRQLTSARARLRWSLSI